MPNMDFLQRLRLGSLFAPDTMIGNDLPSQGGITGNIPTGGGINPTIFGNIDFNSPTPTPTPQEMPPNLDMGPVTPGLPNQGPTNFMSQFEPEHAASDRFNQLASQYPVDQGHSRLGRLGAAILAAGGTLATDDINTGYQLGTGVLNAKHNRQLSDWKNQIEPAYQAANLEKSSNINNRTLAYQAESTRLREEAEQHRVHNDEVRAQIAQSRAEVYKYKAEHPNMRFDFSGPTVKVADPATGEVKDTGLPTGHMTDMDKINLQQDNAIKRIEAGGAQARETEADREKNREKLVGVRGEEERKTKGAPGSPTGGSKQTDLPSQMRIRQAGKARELYNTKPEWRKFIHIKGNDFTIDPPSDGGYFSSGPTKEQYDSINAAIYGTNQPTIPQPTRTGSVPPTTSTPTSTPIKAPPKAPPGWKYVAKPGGGWTAVPDK